MKSVTAKFTAQAQKDAMKFAEADLNGDNALTFEEFVQLHSAAVRANVSLDEIRTWFNDCDEDKDGTVTINEYFVFTLSKAEAQTGDSGLRAVFMEYDKDGTGCLDANEFQKFANTIGFGAAAHDIFMEVCLFLCHLAPPSNTLSHVEESRFCVSFATPTSLLCTRMHARAQLDKDNSGLINYSEILDRIAGIGPSTKKFLMTVAFSGGQENGRGGGGGAGNVASEVVRDLTSWRLDATDATGLVTQLRKSIKASGIGVADMLEIFNFEEKAVRPTALRVKIGRPPRACSRVRVQWKDRSFSSSPPPPSLRVKASLPPCCFLLLWQGTRFDANSSDITLKEFVRAMREKLGFTGSNTVLREAFGLISGGDDKVDGDELFEFVTGRKNAMKLNRDASIAETVLGMRMVEEEELSAWLKALRNDAEEEELTADAMEAASEWTLDELRRALQRMCIKYRIAPHVLLKAWDKDGNGSLSLNEFLGRCKRLVVDPSTNAGSEVWYAKVRPTVRRCFDSLAGIDRTIDLVEFSQFLNKRWPGGSGSSKIGAPAASAPAASSRGRTPSSDRLMDRHVHRSDTTRLVNESSRAPPPKAIRFAADHSGSSSSSNCRSNGGMAAAVTATGVAREDPSARLAGDSATSPVGVRPGFVWKEKSTSSKSILKASGDEDDSPPKVSDAKRRADLNRSRVEEQRRRKAHADIQKRLALPLICDHSSAARRGGVDAAPRLPDVPSGVWKRPGRRTKPAGAQHAGRLSDGTAQRRLAGAMQPVDSIGAGGRQLDWDATPPSVCSTCIKLPLSDVTRPDHHAVGGEGRGEVSVATSASASVLPVRPAAPHPYRVVMRLPANQPRTSGGRSNRASQKQGDVLAASISLPELGGRRKDQGGGHGEGAGGARRKTTEKDFEREFAVEKRRQREQAKATALAAKMSRLGSVFGGGDFVGASPAAPIAPTARISSHAQQRSPSANAVEAALMAALMGDGRLAEFGFEEADEDVERERAATILQAGVRGRKARGAAANAAPTAASVPAPLREEQSLAVDEEVAAGVVEAKQQEEATVGGEEEERAATRLQAGARGRNARKQVEGRKGDALAAKTIADAVSVTEAEQEAQEEAGAESGEGEAAVPEAETAAVKEHEVELAEEEAAAAEPELNSALPDGAIAVVAEDKAEEAEKTVDGSEIVESGGAAGAVEEGDGKEHLTAAKARGMDSDAVPEAEADEAAEEAAEEGMKTEEDAAEEEMKSAEDAAEEGMKTEENAAEEEMNTEEDAAEEGNEPDQMAADAEGGVAEEATVLTEGMLDVLAPADVASAESQSAEPGGAGAEADPPAN